MKTLITSQENGCSMIPVKLPLTALWHHFLKVLFFVIWKIFKQNACQASLDEPDAYLSVNRKSSPILLLNQGYYWKETAGALIFKKVIARPKTCLGIKKKAQQYSSL